jgi:hypothetical protein
VRKVVLEEKAEPTTLADPVVPPVARQAVRRLGDELARLQRGARRQAARLQRPAIGFLMYPQAETGKERLDSLDPDNFKYTITARELKA